MSTGAINRQDGGKALGGSAGKAEKDMPSSGAGSQGAIADAINGGLDLELTGTDIKINLEKLQEVADKLLQNSQILQQLQSLQEDEIEAMIRGTYAFLSKNKISINGVKITDKRVANIFLDDQARKEKIRTIITNYNNQYKKDRSDKTITQLTENAMQAHRIPCVPLFVSDAIKQQKKDMLFTRMNMKNDIKLFELLYGNCLLGGDNGGDEIMVPLQKVRKYGYIVCTIIFFVSMARGAKMGSENPDSYTTKLEMIKMKMEEKGLKLPNESMLMLEEMIKLGIIDEGDIDQIIEVKIKDLEVKKVYDKKREEAKKREEEAKKREEEAKKQDKEK